MSEEQRVEIAMMREMGRIFRDLALVEDGDLFAGEALLVEEEVEGEVGDGY
jgi:hypothetical protein